MKKLLVILLLFFPVHGAGAEIINLECQNKDGISRGYKVKWKSYKNNWELLKEIK